MKKIIISITAIIQLAFSAPMTIDNEKLVGDVISNVVNGTVEAGKILLNPVKMTKNINDANKRREEREKKREKHYQKRYIELSKKYNEMYTKLRQENEKLKKILRKYDINYDVITFEKERRKKKKLLIEVTDK